MTTPRRGRRNISENVRILHDKLVNILSDEDRAYFIRSLNQYQKDRDIIELVTSLKSVLDSPRKREVYPLLREIIPSGDRRYFEKSWHSESRPQSLHSSREWTLTRSRSPNRTLDPQQRPQFHSSLPGNLDKYDSGIDLPNLKNGSHLPRTAQKYPIRRIHIKRSQGMGYGFSMRGGSEHGIGLYVSSVDENSLAEYEGLLPGDHILSVNDVQFDGLAHKQAVKIIKSSKKLNMVVRSVGCIPNTFVAESTYKWIDPSGQRVAPPPNVDSNGRKMSIDGIHRSDLRLLGDDDERKVNIFVDDGDKLGLKIRGGAEYGLGIYIAGVDSNSAADKAGLKCGDQVMDVNGISFLNINHADAVKVLKSAKNMMVTMKDVGRLPFAKTTNDRTKWAKGKLPNISLQGDAESIQTTAQIHPIPDDRRGTAGNNICFERRPEDSKFQHGVVGSQLMYNGTGPSPKSLTEEQARQILNDSEFGTMAYYLEEYRKGYVTVDSFVLALFSLLNTPAKISLLTDIRGSIHPKDIDRFDDLVLKKEIDAIKTRNMTVNEDAQSIHSAYSSSLSSYSGQSSSSRSSAKNSYGGIDSRPITPPRVPEVFPLNCKLKSENKTLTNDSSISSISLASPNSSFNDSQDSSLDIHGLLPVSSSSPRNPKQRMSNGETTKYIHTGDNTRTETVKTHKHQKKKEQKHTEKQAKSSNMIEQSTEDSATFKTLSSDFPEETLKKEKRGFSLFSHSKVRGSYSPSKQHKDHSTPRQEVSLTKKLHEIDSNKTISLEKESTLETNNELTVKKRDEEIPKDVDLGIGISTVNDKKISHESDKRINQDNSLLVSADRRRNDNNYCTLLGNEASKSLKTVRETEVHRLEPDERNLDPINLEKGKVCVGSKDSAFGPPKPPRSFKTTEEIAQKNETEDNVEPRKCASYDIHKGEDDERGRINSLDSSSIGISVNNLNRENQETKPVTNSPVVNTKPPKPKPYQVYVKEQALNEERTSELTEKEANENFSQHGFENKDSIVDLHEDYVEVKLETPVKPKPYLSEKRSDTAKEDRHSMNENNNIAEHKTESHNIIQDIFVHNSQPEKTQVESKAQQQKSYEHAKRTAPSESSDQRDGMFLAMEESHTNRSGLERKTFWGEEDSSSSDFNSLGLFTELEGVSSQNDKTNVTKKNNHLTICKELEAVEESSSQPKRTNSNQPQLQQHNIATMQSAKPNLYTKTDPTISRDVEKSSNHLFPHERTELNKPFKEQLQHNDTLTQSAKSNTKNDPNIPRDVEQSSFHLFPHGRTGLNKAIKEKLEHNVAPTESTQVYKHTKNPYIPRDAEKREIPMVKTLNEDQNQLEEQLPARSLVRNMIDIYNHIATEECPKSKDNVQGLNQKTTNRKSWDGVHQSSANNENKKMPSPQKKKSNSDSNLMNLPKDQKKNIQVKMKASQELLDLQQQAIKSRESSANNSPRHSIDSGQQPRDSNAMVPPGLGLGGVSETPCSNARIVIKSAKEGQYAGR